MAEDTDISGLIPFTALFSVSLYWIFSFLWLVVKSSQPRKALNPRTKNYLSQRR